MNTLTPETLQLAQKIADTLWQTYDDTYGYATEKREENKRVATDNPENIYFFWQQFDWKNQQRFRALLAKDRSPEADRLTAWIRAYVEHEQEMMSEMLQSMREASNDEA